MLNHYRGWIERGERLVPYLLKCQVLDPESRDYGGYVLPTKGYSEPAQAAGCIDVLSSLYFNEESCFFHSTDLLERVDLYMQYLLREQHADGTIDLKETNFHDATAAAFSVRVLAYTYRLYERYNCGNQRERKIMESLYQYLQKAGRGMREGGFHTPNHRWVMASALALVYRIIGEEALREEAEKYLAEGIDCDEEGEYTERSAGIYNVVNNSSLIILAEELNKPELLEAVDRNLHMMLMYMEPDHTLYTLNSRRQDYGRRVYPANYYWNYLWMAYRTGNERFAYMADHLFKLYWEQNLFREEGFGNELTLFMLEPGLVSFQPKMEAPSLCYEHWFQKSGVIRIRREEESLTLLANSTRFLKFQRGENALYMKLAGTFFGDKGRFIPSSIQKTADGYELRYRMEWGYVRPFETPPPTSVWEDMDHGKRQPVQMQLYDVRLKVSWQDGQVLLDFQSEGTEGVLYKLEFIFEPGGFLETEDVRIPGVAGNTVVLKKGKATYMHHFDGITIGEGFCEHNYTDALRGSEAQEQDKFTLYMTGYTPIRRQIRISGHSYSL